MFAVALVCCGSIACYCNVGTCVFDVPSASADTFAAVISFLSISEIANFFAREQSINMCVINSWVCFD